MNKLKRFLVFFIVFTFVVGSLPTNAFATQKTEPAGRTAVAGKVTEAANSNELQGLTPEISVKSNSDTEDSMAISAGEIISDEINKAIDENSDNEPDGDTPKVIEEESELKTQSENLEEGSTQTPAQIFDNVKVHWSLGCLEKEEYGGDQNSSENYLEYADSALLVPKTNGLVITEHPDSNSVTVTGVPTQMLELTPEQYKSYTSIVFLADKVEDHKIYIHDTVVVNESDITIKLKNLDKDDFNPKDIYKDVKIEFGTEEDGISLPDIHKSFNDDYVKGDVTIKPEVDPYFKWDWKDSEFALRLSFDNDFDLQMKKKTTSKDLGENDAPADGDIQTYDMGSIGIPLEVVDVVVGFTYRTCCTNPIYLKGSSKNEFSVGTDNHFNSKTTYSKVEPQTNNKTYAYVAAGFGGGAGFSIYVASLNLTLSGVGGDRIVVTKDTSEYKEATSRTGKEKDRGLIHYCAVDGNGNHFCVSGTHGSVRNGYLRLYFKVNIVFKEWDWTITDWSFAKSVDRSQDFYYSTRYGTTGKEGRTCPHIGYQVEALVYDNSGAIRQGAEVSSTDYANIKDSIEQKYAKATTNQDGIARIYKPAGNYEFIASGCDESISDSIVDSPIEIAFNSPDIRRATVGVKIPKEAETQLPTKEEMDVVVDPYDPQTGGDRSRIDSAKWKNDKEVAITKSQIGYQYLHLKLKAAQNRKFAESVKVLLSNNDKSLYANKNFAVISTKLNEDRTEVDVIAVVRISSGQKTYHLTVNDALWGSGDYAPGETVMIVSKLDKNMLDKIQEYVPEPFATLMGIIRGLIPASWSKIFLKWEIDRDDSKSLKYERDFLPVFYQTDLTEGLIDKTYAISFFKMPKGDVELTAIYGEPKVIDKVEMDLEPPVPEEELNYWATSETEGLESPLSPLSDEYPILWLPNVLPLFDADYDSTYIATIKVDTEDDYEFKWPLGLGTKAFVTKPADSTSEEPYVKADSFIPVGDFSVVSHEYHTPKPQLVEVVQPTTVYFENGTGQKAINDFLNNYEVNIVTETGNDKTNANWGKVVDTSDDQKTGRFVYKKSLKEEQKVEDTEVTDPDNPKKYTVKGEIVLPDKYINTKTPKHEIVSQDVEITVVIKGTGSEEINPPTANPAPESEYPKNQDLSVELKNDEQNPEGTKIWYRTEKDGELEEEEYKEYNDNEKIKLEADTEEDIEYTIYAYAQKGESGEAKKSEIAAFTYKLTPKDAPRELTLINALSEKPEDGKTTLTLMPGTRFSVVANPGEGEKFAHKWRWTEKGGEEKYIEVSNKKLTDQVMPNHDLELEADMIPIDEDKTFTFIEAKIKTPQAGEAFSTDVNSRISYKESLGGGSVTWTVFSDPEPIVQWNVEKDETAQAGKTYMGSITYNVMNVRTKSGDIIEEVLFDPFLGSELIKNSEDSKKLIPHEVILSENRMLATLLFTIEIPEAEYTVSYNANGGSNPPASQIKKAGKDLKLSTKKPEPPENQESSEKAVFAGWADTDKAQEAQYQPGDMYTKDEDVTLYAVWGDQAKVTVTAKVNESSSEMGSVDPGSQILDKGDDAHIKITPNDNTDDGEYRVETVTKKETGSETEKDITNLVKNNKLVLKNVVRDTEVEVDFALYHTITAEIDETVEHGKPGIHGSITPKKQDVKDGEDAKLEITPDNGYEIDNVKVSTSGSQEATDVTEQVENGTLKLENIKHNTKVTVKFKPEEYTIKYDANGGSGEPDEQTKYHDVDLKLSKDKPTRDRYTFAGWALSKDAEESFYEPGDTFTINKDTTLYAVWEAKPQQVYVIAKAVGPGTVSPDEKTWINKGNNITIEMNPDEGEYTENYIQKVMVFNLNTMEARDKTDSIEDNKLTLESVGDNTEVVVHFATRPHTVTAKVDGEGGTVSPTEKKVAHNGDITITMEPDVSHTIDSVTAAYENGEEADLTEDVKENKLVLEDVEMNIDVTVSYKLQEYTVHYDGNGGRNVPADQVKTHGKELKLSEKRPTYEGYEFAGWATNERAERVEYQPGGAYNREGDQTLYAVWTGEKEKVYVTTEAIGPGTVSPAKKTWLEKGDDIDITMTPDEEKYVENVIQNVTVYDKEHEEGIDKTADVEKGKLSLTNITSNTHVKVTFETRGNHTVKAAVKDGNGTVTPENQTVKHHENATITMDPSEGYTVKSVTAHYQDETSKDLTGDVKNNTLVLKNVVMDINVVVTYKPQTFTVHYDGNGGTGVPEDQVKTYGEELTLSNNTPTYDGYKFKGWTTVKTSLEVEYQPGDKYTEEKDVTLYAVWERKVLVTAKAIGPGSVSPESILLDNYGNVEIRIEPNAEEYDPNYIEKVMVYDSGSGEGTDRTADVKDGVLSLKKVTKDTNVEVTFGTKQYTVTAEAKGKGKVTPTEIQVKRGQGTEIKFTPEKRYKLVEVMLYDEANPDGINVLKNVNKNGVLMLDNVLSDTRVEGYFKEKGSPIPDPDPDTGDNAPILPVMALMLGAGIAGLLTLLRRREK